MDKKFSDDIQELNLDDMDAVTGGVFLASGKSRMRRVDDTVGKTVSVSGASMPQAASMSAGSNDISSVIPDSNVVVPPGVPAVMMLCPDCQSEQWHRVFSGGRAKCMACGLVH